MNLFHKVGILTVCMILAVVLSCATARAEIVDRIVANVNGQIILYSDLQHQMELLQKRMPTLDISDPAQKSKIEREVLNQMIQQKLADMEVKRLKIKVSDSEVDSRLREIMKQNHLTKAQLKQDLEANGSNLKEFREQIKKNIARAELMDRVLKSKVVISDQQVDAYLKGEKGEAATTSRRFHLGLIVLPVGPQYGTPEEVKKTGNELVTELKGGADFRTLAKNYSKGPSAKEGGDVGYMQADELAPFISKAIRNLKKGQVSDLVEGPAGYYIVKVFDITSKHVKMANSALREKVRKILYEREVNRKYTQWVHNLESKAFIQISL